MDGIFKIDRRRNYLVVLDTETCNTPKDDKGQLDTSSGLVYDIGWAVVDKWGNVYLTRSFIIREIFKDKELMDSAYYRQKVPKYEEDIKAGTRIVVDWYQAIMCLRTDMEMFETNIVIAHNAPFDYRVMNSTERYLTKSKYRYALPYGTEIWDSVKMATDTIGQQKTYRKFCEENGFMTKHKVPRPKMTAEVLTKFFNGDLEYTEEHTALEDVLIEKEIVARCYRTHKAMRRRAWGD